MKEMHPRARNLIGGVLIVYAGLVATHEGEFWPFGIYPMFSEAGNPWAKAVVRDISNTPVDELGRAYSLHRLPGNPVALDTRRINQNDLSNFLVKSSLDDPRNLAVLENLLRKEKTAGAQWLLCRVDGKLDHDSVHTTATPLVIIGTDSTHVILPDNPPLTTGQ